MNKVLVTGGTGFLGRQLALKLHQQSNCVTVIGRNLKIGQELQNLGLRFLPLDIRDQTAVRSAIEGQDVVFHCAALSSPWGRDEEFYTINVLGTRHIIQGCLNHQVKHLIHVSTSAVYFNLSDRLNIKETDPLASHPINAYIKTKQLAEQEILNAFRQGLSVIGIRPRGIFGPGDTTILPRLLRVNQSAGIPFIKEGQAILDLSYIDNVVDALLLCETASASCLGRYFNISNGEPTSLFELLQILAHKLEIPLKLKPIPYPIANTIATVMEMYYPLFLPTQEPPLTRYTLGLLTYSQTLDITEAKAELGYQPRIRLIEGIQQFANWWKTQ